MMLARRIIGPRLLRRAIMLVACSVRVGMAQHTHAPVASSEAESFVREARAAAARYKNRSEAVAEGYRRIGPDFPLMGEHWVHPGLLVSGTIDVAHPPVLTYVQVGRQVVLTGVAYALPLEADEAPPSFPFAGAWHDHKSALNEESVLLHSPTSAPNDHAPRLSMLHVWTTVANPAGIFAQDNPGLPFARFGVRLLDPPSNAAARALSLAAGGHRYYAALIRRLTGLTSTEFAPVDSVLALYGAEADAWREAATQFGIATDADLDGLEHIWRRLWRTLSVRVPASARERVDALRDP